LIAPLLENIANDTSVLNIARWRRQTPANSNEQLAQLKAKKLSFRIK
jgi:hypothetical protein